MADPLGLEGAAKARLPPALASRFRSPSASTVLFAHVEIRRDWKEHPAGTAVDS
jgi:hypothetical protein